MRVLSAVHLFLYLSHTQRVFLKLFVRYGFNLNDGFCYLAKFLTSSFRIFLSDDPLAMYTGTLHVRFSWRVLCVCSLLDKRYRRMLWLHHAQVCILISATMYTMLIVEATRRFAIVIELPINDTMYIYSTWWGFKELNDCIFDHTPFSPLIKP